MKRFSKSVVRLIVAPFLISAAVAIAGAASAQQSPAVDPFASDPVGVVDDPCPVHPDFPGRTNPPALDIHTITRDFGFRCRYRAENAQLAAAHTRVRVVFMGDSITEGWIKGDPSLFGNGVVDRGISGQTTPQMLVRFRDDVIDLHPEAVHIMAGINDIVGNTGATTIPIIEGNIRSMAQLAQANHIRVIIASVLPAGAFPWKPRARPAPLVVALNRRLKAYAAANGFVFVDYHARMATADGAMREGLASDGVHPTPEGYAVMRPMAIDAIAKVARKRK